MSEMHETETNGVLRPKANIKKMLWYITLMNNIRSEKVFGKDIEDLIVDSYTYDDNDDIDYNSIF